MEAVAGPVVEMEAGGTVLSLPEGSTMMVGEDGEQYVTIVQDGQTYAIPLAEYQTMQPGGTITIQAQQLTTDDMTGIPPQVVVQATPAVASPANIAVLESISSPKTPSSIKWGMSGGAQAHLGPQNVSQMHPKPFGTLEARKFKPIRVDNWGIFLLNRLQTYFQKKEYVDLTLRFPERNAQIKVHKLVVNACTDYFVKAESLGLIVDGVYDMPSNFLPELVAPVMRFMYSGRLDLKSHMFTKLRETAMSLGMSVLTKLLDAQLTTPPEILQQQAARKPAKKSFLDPVRQIKKIKKIEKKFIKDQRQEQVMQKRIPIPGLDSDKIVPGKKLPIWKKRETAVNSNMNEVDVKDKTPAIPRQLREMQENLNFEKVRQTAAIRETGMSNEKEMSVEEIKEFMAEQRKGTDDVDEADDDDDYYDNDAGLDYDEAMEDEEDAHVEQPSLNLTPAKPILKTEPKESPLPRKSVRFSLRPGSVPAPKETELITPDVDNEVDNDENDENIADDSAASTERSKKSKTEKDAMDQTVEEFSKVVEQEEKELENSTSPTRVTRTTRRGRPINPPNLDLPETSPKKAAAAKKPADKAIIPTLDQTAMISELMKKNPELFKGNKPVKIKVMAKDANGKSVVKVITVKAQPQTIKMPTIMNKSIDLTSSTPEASPGKSKPSSVDSSPKVITTPKGDEFGIRNLPRVKYTGRRGRPPLIKPGEDDPHVQERQEIAQKMQNSTAKIVIQKATSSSDETYTTFEQVSDKLVHDGGSPNSLNASQLDPSSEAEALSHVASGIAASLGLASADSPSQELTESNSISGPLSDLEHFDTATTSSSNFEARNSSKRPRSPEFGSPNDQPAKKVSKLAMEWNEDDEEGGSAGEKTA